MDKLLCCNWLQRHSTYTRDVQVTICSSIAWRHSKFGTLTLEEWHDGVVNTQWLQWEGLMEVELQCECDLPLIYAWWLTSCALHFLWSPSLLKWLVHVVLTNPTAPLHVAALAFKHPSPVMILLHCTWCFKQDNFAQVVEESRVLVGIIRCSGDLKHRLTTKSRPRKLPFSKKWVFRKCT